MVFDYSIKKKKTLFVLCKITINCLLSLQAALNERDLMSNKVKELMGENKTIKETQKNVQVLNVNKYIFFQKLPSLSLQEKC